MKKIFMIFNFFLIFMIIGFIFMKPSKRNFSIAVVPRSLTTNLFYGSQTNLLKDSIFQDSNKLNDAVASMKNGIVSQTAGASVVVSPKSTVSSASSSVAVVDAMVLETLVGTMSAYGLDCVGCSGVVGSGYPARENNLMYYDATYGNLRIVAGDKKYPYGTVVRAVNSKIGTFDAIILDRGGEKKKKKRYLFDLLFSTEAEASQFGLSRDTTFQILRYGY